MFSLLQHNQSIKLTQPGNTARPMAPGTLTDLIAPGTCMRTNVAIMPESENVLWKGGIPEDDVNRRECNDMGEPKAGPPQ